MRWSLHRDGQACTAIGWGMSSESLVSMTTVLSLNSCTGNIGKYVIHLLCRLNECSWRHIAIQILYVRPCVRPLKFRLTFFKLLLFEQVRFNYNQTWMIGALWEPSHYDALGGHMTRSKVI